MNMKHVSGYIVLVGFLLSFPLYAQNSCECPTLKCDPCSVEKGMTFFSEKCGPDNLKVKSCARPTCVPIEEATKACPVPPNAGSGPREPIVVGGAGEAVKMEAATGANEVAPAGKVKVIQGSVSIVHADGKKSVVTSEAAVREGDIVESGKESGAVVHFNGGNKLHVQPDTAVELKEFQDQQSAASRKAMLHLIRGKIRNQVEQKYNGKSSYYRVITKGAVAGVRGTDFLVEHSESGKMETRIETLGGKVILMNLDESESREINKGEGAVYIAELPSSSDFVVRGKLSDVYQIPAERLAVLDRDSRMDVARAKRGTASVDSAICEKPKALLNQCAWKCEGNPSGEKVCRTDLSQVRCVRQRCNANGKWADEIRMPAATSQTLCPPQGALVKDCDY